MDKSKFYAGLAVMAGLIFAGLMLPQAVKTYRSFDRTVNVKGLCEREVKADRAIWPIVFKIGSNDLGTVYSTLEYQAAKVKDFLKEGGIQDSEITQSTTLSDKNTFDYDSNRSQRYIMKTVMTVCTDNVDAVLSLMSRQEELIRLGIAIDSDWSATPEFAFEALNDIKPEMIEEATHNAREVALKFAKDSDSRLGKIKDASQGTFSISDRDSNTPYIKKVRVVSNITYYLSK